VNKKINFSRKSKTFYDLLEKNSAMDTMKKSIMKLKEDIESLKNEKSILEFELQKKNIRSIQIFLNLIFADLSNLIKNFKITKKDSEREMCFQKK